MITDDFLQVIYAPKKAFKRIIENPKYLAALIVIIVFMALQVGYEYTQFSKTYAEDTTLSHYDSFINATSGYWQGSSGVNITNNFNDNFNYTVFTATQAGYRFVPEIFGNSSLQISAVNTGNVSVAIGNAFNVDCSLNGYQNLSMVIKQVQPQTVPEKVTLSLYSINDADYYQYDLTNSMSSATDLNQWSNLTIPIGPNAAGWTIVGSPTWSNITSLKMDLVFPANSNVTVNVGALFFRGHFESFTQYDSTGVLLLLLQAFSLQFLLGWLVITGIIYLMLRLLKNTTLWKPLFIAVGCAMFVLVIRAVINLFVAFALPAAYYPFDLSGGVGFTPYGALAYPGQFIGIVSASSQAAFNNIESAMAVFRGINVATLVMAYVWLGGLCTIILGTVKPEFPLLKRIALSALALGITILLLIYLVVGIA